MKNIENILFAEEMKIENALISIRKLLDISRTFGTTWPIMDSFGENLLRIARNEFCIEI
jgi:hypothetical protein